MEVAVQEATEAAALVHRQVEAMTAALEAEAEVEAVSPSLALPESLVLKVEAEGWPGQDE